MGRRRAQVIIASMTGQMIIAATLQLQLLAAAAVVVVVVAVPAAPQQSHPQKQHVQRIRNVNP